MENNRKLEYPKGLLSQLRELSESALLELIYDELSRRFGTRPSNAGDTQCEIILIGARNHIQQRMH